VGRVDDGPVKFGLAHRTILVEVCRVESSLNRGTSCVYNRSVNLGGIELAVTILVGHHEDRLDGVLNGLAQLRG